MNVTAECIRSRWMSCWAWGERGKRCCCLAACSCMQIWETKAKAALGQPQPWHLKSWPTVITGTLRPPQLPPSSDRWQLFHTCSNKLINSSQNYIYIYKIYARKNTEKRMKQTNKKWYSEHGRARPQPEPMGKFLIKWLSSAVRARLDRTREGTEHWPPPASGAATETFVIMQPAWKNSQTTAAAAAATTTEIISQDEADARWGGSWIRAMELKL